MSKLLILFLIFLFLTAFGKANDVLTFKVIQVNGIDSPSKKDNKNNLILTVNGADIQCISQTARVDTNKYLVIHPERKSLDEVLTRDVFNSTGKLSKGDKLVENPDYHKKTFSIIFKLTESAGKRLNQITKKNVGRPMQVIYNDEVISTAIIQGPLSSAFQLTLVPEKLFNDLKHNLNLQECQI